MIESINGDLDLVLGFKPRTIQIGIILTVLASIVLSDIFTSTIAFLITLGVAFVSGGIGCIYVENTFDKKYEPIYKILESGLDPSRDPNFANLSDTIKEILIDNYDFEQFAKALGIPINNKQVTSEAQPQPKDQESLFDSVLNQSDDSLTDLLGEEPIGQFDKHQSIMSTKN